MIGALNLVGNIGFQSAHMYILLLAHQYLRHLKIILSVSV